jgi:MFS superfamily sulfate permease-like transporter
MAKLTVTFGVLLILLGLIGYEAPVIHSFTALIPAVFGLVLVVLGILAMTPNQKKRMIVMHIAVTVGLVGFLGTVKGVYDFIRMETGHFVAIPQMAEAQAAMALMMLCYVLLCVRSFIEARRARG